MIMSFLQALGCVILVLLLQWKTLKKESRNTRWLAYGFFAASIALWTYLSGLDEVWRPMVGLEKWLEPLDPTK